MIKVSYSNIQSKIKINGLLSDPFTHKREVFQVCALSMLLYFIVAELLPNFIDTNKRIKGIQIGQHEIELVNFADGTTIFLRDITCLNRKQVILKLYKEASSSQINFSKTRGFLTNDLRVSSYESRFTIHCTSYGLLFTYELRVTIYCTSYGFLFAYELLVITYCRSYNLIFTYELRVTIYCTSCTCNIDCVKFLYCIIYFFL